MIPFLQRRLKQFTLVPIVLGHGFDTLAMAGALSPLFDEPQTLLVASTDLSHDEPYDVACAHDRSCVDRILALDVKGVAEAELCGKMPVLVLLQIARLRGWQAVMIDYKNSGDTTNNKNGRIVGYTAVAFTEIPGANPQKDSAQDTGEDISAGKKEERNAMLTDEQKKELLTFARDTIVAKLNGNPGPALPKGPPVYGTKLGCFVTLHKQGQLRGCIGHIWPQCSLVEAVRDNALSSAFNDHRFKPVVADEMATIDMEISVLTVPTELVFSSGTDLLQKLKPRIHGVVITQGLRRSTYLPQVWEQIPDKALFLSYLCRKGGMPTDAWKLPGKTKIEVYEAFVFSEKELGLVAE